MEDKSDKSFYDRADAHIELSNRQLVEMPDRGKVSASMLYSVARFNAWVSACGVGSAEELAATRQDAVEYFCRQYRMMLEDHLDDYVAHFQKYMKSVP